MSFGRRSVAITGASGAIGRLLMAELDADDSVTSVVGLDACDAPGPLGRKGAWRRLDLGVAAAAHTLAEAIDEHDVDTLVHLGWLSESRGAGDRQEAEVTRLVDALRRRPVPRVVYASTTAVCGTLPGDPGHLGETAPYVDQPESEWLRDKVAAERVVRALAFEGEAVVTVLRLALVIGPTVRTFVTEYLDRAAVPVVVGVDPPVQFLHERDAAAALRQVIRRDYEGVFNIVGDGAVPLSVALRIGRRRPAPLPALGTFPLTQLLWDAALAETPAVLRDLFKFVWVADGTKALDELGFQARFSTKEAVEDFYRVQPTP